MKKSFGVSALLFSLLLWSCGGDDASPTGPTTTPKPTPVATSVTLSVTSLSFVSLGETSDLSATVKDQNGATMTGQTVTWGSSHAPVASVSSTGLVTSVADGTVTITASSGSVSAAASVTVAQVPASLMLSPDSMVFAAPGDTATVIATVKDAGGTVIVSPTLTWASSDTSTATVSSSGLVTAVASGPAATVTAQAGEGRATVSARVGGAYLTVTVTVDGDPLSGISVWLTDPTTEHMGQSTDSLGKALFRNLGAGEHGVTLRDLPPGFIVANSQTIQVEENESSELTFNGRFGPAQVSGTAKAWGKPIADAVIRIEGKDTVEVVVSALGGFQVDSVVKGDYTFTISNYDGVRFREDTLTQNLEPGDNIVDFRGKPDPINWEWISLGGEHTCGMLESGQAYCWGQNLRGQLGTGTESVLLNSQDPVAVVGGHTWQSLTAGKDNSCAIAATGEAYCWGDYRDRDASYGGGEHGLLGSFSFGAWSPLLVNGGLTWTEVSTGRSHSCGVTTGGDAYCWGINEQGQLGTGVVLDGYGVQSSCASSIEWCGPLLVSGGFNWASVSAGEFHTCGVTTGGEGYCWGYGSDYQLGEIGGRGPHLNPNPVNGSHTWKTISAGNHHSCGVTTADDAYCWGNNDYGQLGDGNLAERPEIIPVSGGRAWASIDVGYDHTCGVTTGGEGYCWGKNHGGQLGHGSTSTSPTTQPGVVIGGFTWASITAGEAHTCGVTTVGGAYCWGHDTYGQLGDGPGRNAGFSPLLVKVGGNW